MHFPAHFVLQWGAWLSFLYKNNTAAALVKKRGKFATNQVVYLKSVVVILGYLPVLISWHNCEDVWNPFFLIGTKLSICKEWRLLYVSSVTVGAAESQMFLKISSCSETSLQNVADKWNGVSHVIDLLRTKIHLSNAMFLSTSKTTFCYARPQMFLFMILFL